MQLFKNQSRAFIVCLLHVLMVCDTKESRTRGIIIEEIKTCEY